jgi:hypothetical protein
LKSVSKKVIVCTIAAACVIGLGNYVSPYSRANADTLASDSTQTTGGSQPNARGAGNGPQNRAYNLLQIAASVLGIQQSSVMDSLKSGKSLAQIASEQGLSEDDFLQKLNVGVNTAIDAKVADGTLTQDEADSQKSTITAQLKQQIETTGLNASQGKNPKAGSGTGNAGSTGQAPSNNSNSVNTLTDIEGHWAAAYIKDLVAKGILQGDQNGHFNPDTTVTREELAAMTARSFKLSSSGYKNFTDVQPDRWSYDNIEATKDYFNTYTDAQGNVSFQPAEGAKREDVAVTLVKVLLKQDSTMKLLDDATADQLLKEKFKDAEQIPADLRDYIATAVQNNLIQGDDQGNFAPAKTITRGEVATLLDRLLTGQPTL